MEEGKRPALVDEIENQSIVYVKDKNSTWTRRTAKFLNPHTQDVNQAVRVPKTPPLSKFFAKDHRKWPPNVDIRGWKRPQKKWNEWVERLAENHAVLWNQTGICDAIMSSLYDVAFNPDIVIGLVEFWCPETNTFVFPWGEATITLEDVMILGGFSVIGESVSDGKSKTVEEMNREWTVVMRPSDRKTSFSGWFKHFAEHKRGESETEHVGFLSLWLSRYVFPSWPENTIATHAFPIAAQLAGGRRVALAQPVLASIYARLTSLRTQIIYGGSIVVFEPFRLVQLWAYEHFRDFWPNLPNALNPGEPRVARWNKLNLNFDANTVRSGLKRVEGFDWRPYAADLKNWRHLSYYKDTEQVFVDSLSVDDEIKSFLVCLQAVELKGISCKAKYNPQRVAMQFGMDQDLPGDCSVYGLSGEDFRVYIPPRTFLAGVSDRYLSWWKSMMVDKMGRNANSRTINEEEVCDSSETRICRQSDDSVIPKQSVQNTFPNESKPDSESKVTRPTEISTRIQVDMSRQETRNNGSNECKEIVVSLAQNGKRKRVGESIDHPMDVEKAGESFKNPFYIDDYAEMATREQVQPSLAELEDLKKTLAEREEEVKKLNKAINDLKTANSKLAKKVNGLLNEEQTDFHQALEVYKASLGFSGAVTKTTVPGYVLGAKDAQLAIYAAILKNFPGFDFMACGLDPPEQVKNQAFCLMDVD